MKTGLQLVAQEPRSILGRTRLLQKGLDSVTAGGRGRQEEGRSMTFQQAELRHYLVKIVTAGSGGDIIHVCGHSQGRWRPGAWWGVSVVVESHSGFSISTLATGGPP